MGIKELRLGKAEEDSRMTKENSGILPLVLGMDGKFKVLLRGSALKIAGH